MSDQQIAQQCRERGRQLFSSGLWRDAIKEYSRAVQHSPSEPLLYTNRALCHLKLLQWQEAVDDATKAVELDPKCLKGYYFKGKAHLGAGEWASADRELAKALELTQSSSQTKEFHDDIFDALYIARKRKWRSEEAHRLKQIVKLQELCKDLIKKSGATGLDNSILDPETEMQLGLVDQLFEQETSKLIQKEVPECFCCRISMDIMRDPVITPSGISYDRKHLTQHLQRVGNFDPVTRETLLPTQMRPNFNLREAIADFLTEYPWAFPGE